VAEQLHGDLGLAPACRFWRRAQLPRCSRARQCHACLLFCLLACRPDTCPPLQIQDHTKTTAVTHVLGWGFGNSPAPPVASIARSGNSWPLSVSCCPWPIDRHRHGVNAHARHRHAAVWLPRGWYHAGAGFAIPACDGAQQMTRDPAREERQTRHSDRETEMQPSPCQKRDVVAAVPLNGAPARRRYAGLLSFAAGAHCCSCDAALGGACVGLLSRAVESCPSSGQ
jgi:hypothetical protein